MIKHMKGKIRNDIKLIGAFLIVSLLLLMLLRLFLSQDGAFVRISVDGELFAEYDLSEERTVIIEGTGGFENTLVIKEKTADIINAGCPDRLCVRQKAISHTGESLICLPNRVVVEITGVNGNEVDVIAR